MNNPSITGSIANPALPNDCETVLEWSGLFGSARGLAIINAARTHAGPVIILMPDMRSSTELLAEIRFYAAGSDLPVLIFPDWEILPYDALSPHPDIISRRLLALHRLPELERGIVISTIGSVMHRLCPQEYVDGSTFLLQKGDTLNIENVRSRLARAGYHSVSQVMAPGEYAVRGGLIDLYPAGSATPYRLDLFGDEIDSIRIFDPATQRSMDMLEQIRLLPAREFAMSEDAISGFRQRFRARFAGDPQKAIPYREISAGHVPAGAEYYLPLFFDKLENLFDYLPAQSLLIFDEAIDSAMKEFMADAGARFDQLGHDQERPILPPDALFLSAKEMSEAISSWPRLCLVRAESASSEARTRIHFDSLPPPMLPVEQRADSPYAKLYEHLKQVGRRYLVVASSPGRRETLRGLLHEHGLHALQFESWAEFATGDEPVGITVSEMDKGLVLISPDISIITEMQLYGERATHHRRRHAQTGTDSIIRSLGELQIGDPVVHEDYGVGRYQGLQTLDLGDGPSEFLCLSYADDDKIYIPVVALHSISRYTATHPGSAPLHKLGGDAWEKARRRAREKAHDAAIELLEMHALRATRKGHRYAAPDEHYDAFAASFPFEETVDQAAAIEDIVKDMISDKPMDRLVCGDVGFGKTEVAMRAAYLASTGGKQVALLAPTTLLAQQHHNNFSDRFADLPVRIELLSRFRTKAEQEQVLAGLAGGTVDIIIGTHRLLQDDICFANLGLIIIDEEHRFGVRQKERLKKLRANTDILTLTATPIPRTLNMALAGLRDISIIATPPHERLAVKTIVMEWRDGIIREACLREIRRGGQVFFLHNEVRTMEKALHRLSELVPEAEIRMAHGQMGERELEHIMLDFYHQRFNILLSSTIIESGIDIPTANTIIIERADKFGLAQLHQLRGRVGRSHHRAYAYLISPERQSLSADAKKRLEAIGMLEELGAGFALASQDLEIRGAGELLGESQSGEIDEVGFTMYSDLLNQAVESLKQGREPIFDEMHTGGPEINLHAPALFPEDYLPDVHLRLVLYKRVSSASHPAQLLSLKEEVIDRFGMLPAAALLLFEVAALRIAATPLRIHKIDAGPKGARIDFNKKPNIDPASVIALLQSSPGTYRLQGPERLRITQSMAEVAQRVKAIRTVLDALETIEDSPEE